MEQIGGNADAYEEPPQPESQPEPAPIVEKPNPFREPEKPLAEKPEPAPEPEEPGLAEKTGLTVEEPQDGDEDLFAKILAENPAWTEDMVEPPRPDDSDCATGLDDLFELEHGYRPATQPDPLDDNYQLHGTVWSCGELADVYNGFIWITANGEPHKVKLDSGEGEIQKIAMGNWVLEDPVKDRKYLKEIGNLAGFLEVKDIFIWVMGLSDGDQEFGYIHNGWVFLPKEQP
jgi:hypothetical protein